MTACPYRRTHEFDADGLCRHCYALDVPDVPLTMPSNWAAWTEAFVKRTHWLALFEGEREVEAPCYRRAICEVGTFVRVEKIDQDGTSKIELSNVHSIHWPTPTESWGRPDRFVFFKQPIDGDVFYLMRIPLAAGTVPAIHARPSGLPGPAVHVGFIRIKQP